MDSSQWTQTQEIGVTKSMATISPSPNECTRTTVMERKVRPQKDQALNCPRCHSTNTKFCYYNNYSLTQPRYFCKSCRRYWTEGGTLRNVPVGDGSRKNKKSNPNISPSLSMATTTSVSSSHKLPDLNPSIFSSPNPKSHDHQAAQDLNLGFQAPQDYYHHGIPQFLEFPKIENRNVMNSSSSSSSSSSFSAPLSAINLLRNGIAVRGLMNSSIPMAPETNAIFSSGFQFQECKPSLAFSFEGFHGNSGSTYSHENNINESLLFPFGTMKRHSSMSTTDQADDQSIKGHENSNSNGYNWNGMLG